MSEAEKWIVLGGLGVFEVSIQSCRCREADRPCATGVRRSRPVNASQTCRVLHGPGSLRLQH